MELTNSTSGLGKVLLFLAVTLAVVLLSPCPAIASEQQLPPLDRPRAEEQVDIIQGRDFDSDTKITNQEEPTPVEVTDAVNLTVDTPALSSDQIHEEVNYHEHTETHEHDQSQHEQEQAPEQLKVETESEPSLDGSSAQEQVETIQQGQEHDMESGTIIAQQEQMTVPVETTDAANLTVDTTELFSNQMHEEAHYHEHTDTHEHDQSQHEQEQAPEQLKVETEREPSLDGPSAQEQVETIQQGQEHDVESGNSITTKQEEMSVPVEITDAANLTADTPALSSDQIHEEVHYHEHTGTHEHDQIEHQQEPEQLKAETGSEPSLDASSAQEQVETIQQGQEHDMESGTTITQQDQMTVPIEITDTANLTVDIPASSSDQMHEEAHYHEHIDTHEHDQIEQEQEQAPEQLKAGTESEPSLDGPSAQEQVETIQQGQEHDLESGNSIITQQEEMSVPVETTDAANFTNDVPASFPDETSEEIDHDHEHAHEHGQTGHDHLQMEVETTGSHFISVVKHLSYSLLSFLPEHLQDTILDVNDALILTGIIALTLVSVCVPYFFFETYMAVYPLKKKVVELNRNLWKVSTAYENQQEDYEAYKKKALAYDEDKDKIDKLETELHLVKQLDVKNQATIKKLQRDLRYSSKVASEVENLVGTTMSERDKALEELEKMKGYLLNTQTKLKQTNEALETTKTESINSTMNVDVLNHSNNLLELKIKALEKDVTEFRAKLLAENEKRKLSEDKADKYLTEKDSLQKELTDLKKILHQYEETASSLSQEISLKENELMTLKESLGEDSPLIEAAEVSAKLKSAEENTISLQLRVDCLTLENGSLSQQLDTISNSAGKLEIEKVQAENKLKVLESYFKEKEEELRTMVEKYETEKRTRGMDKEGLIALIEQKEDEVRELNRRIETMKQELEDTKQSHRNEIRNMETKEHENWLLLCQSERKLQESRKNADVLRQKLTVVAREKEKDDEGMMDDLDGDIKMNNFFPVIPGDLIPLPLPDDDTPTYIGLGLGIGIMPPLPLDDEDDDEEDMESTGRDREPQRPPPVGRLSGLSPTFSGNGNGPVSPIAPRGFDYSSGSSSPPPHRRPPSRESWINGNDHGSDHHRRHRGPPRTSSPVNRGVNV